MNGQLPTGWTRMALSGLGTWGSGGTPSRNDLDGFGPGIPWLKIGDLKDGPVRAAAESITNHGLASSAAKLLDAGTLLVAMYGSIGKLGITTFPCATNQAIASCVPRTGVDLSYLFYALLNERQRLLGLGQGGTQLNISQTLLKAHEINVAPVKEQQRIVSRIEELFSEIDEGERALERVGQLVERYRQSILKAAVTGELTREWRDANGGPRVPRTTSRDASEAVSLPAGWEYAALSELGEFGRGKSKHRPRNDPRLFGGPYPFLQTGTVRASQGLISTFDSTYSELGLGQSKLWPKGTVCITIAANIAESGILSFDACFPDSIVGLVPGPRVLGEFVEMFIRTARESLDRFAPATAQKNINLDILEKVRVPLPPLNEQEEICSRAREMLSRIASIESSLDQGRVQSAALRQSILKAAFSGQLVPQDPHDEPASALLARLAAQAAEAPAAPRRRGAPRKNALA